MDCLTCCNLKQTILAGTSHDIQDFRHDFWTLDRSLDEIRSASSSGCDVCYVLSTALLSAAEPYMELDSREVRVKILIPGPDFKHNRVRAIASYRIASKPSPTHIEHGMDLEFYSTFSSPVAPWSEFGNGNIIERKTDVEFCSCKIQEWLDACSTVHDQCTAMVTSFSNNFLPTRVIDLGLEESRLHVVHAKGQQGRYIAFSYCWGDGDIPKTVTLEMPQIHHIASLPAAFQDVVRLCRLLNVRYLWIDCLCIVQRNKNDWEAESSQMLKYYSGAYLVVAANRASNPFQGLFGPRPSSYIIEPRHPNGQKVIARRYGPHLACDQALGLSSPLDCRAWALQERLSAQRIIHFYEHEMIWECESRVMCECGMLTNRNQRLEDNSTPLRKAVTYASITAATREECFHQWSTLIERFTSCLLTQDTDRLPAIEGLARLFEGSGLQLYRAGMWTESMPRSLLWKVANTTSARRPREYVGPSWSWISLVGHVDWNLCFEYHLRYLGTVLDCETSPSGLDPFGKITGGLLKMRACSWETELEYQPSTGFMALACGERAYFDINSEEKTSTFYQYPLVKCVAIAEGSPARGLRPSTLLALILEKAGEERGVPQYSRIGLAALDYSRLSLFSNDIITII